MTRYEQIQVINAKLIELELEIQALATAATDTELALVGAGPVTMTYGDDLQDAADAVDAARASLATVAKRLQPVPASGVCMDRGIVNNQLHRALSPDRAMNRLMRFETIGDEDLLVYAESH